MRLRNKQQLWYRALDPKTKKGNDHMENHEDERKEYEEEI